MEDLIDLKVSTAMSSQGREESPEGSLVPFLLGHVSQVFK